MSDVYLYVTSIKPFIYIYVASGAVRDGYLIVDRQYFGFGQKGAHFAPKGDKVFVGLSAVPRTQTWAAQAIIESLFANQFNLDDKFYIHFNNLLKGES